MPLRGIYPPDQNTPQVPDWCASQNPTPVVGTFSGPRKRPVDVGAPLQRWLELNLISPTFSTPANFSVYHRPRFTPKVPASYNYGQSPPLEESLVPGNIVIKDDQYSLDKIWEA